MATKINKLSALAVRTLDKPGYHGDGGGLFLQVSGTGSKSWIFRFAISRKAHEMGLGSLHTVDLATARQRAKECRLMLLDGKNPLSERRSARTAQNVVKARRTTFDECAAAYIDAHRIRLRGRIECILDWATVSKFRQGENPARWRGHLDNLLANPNKIAPVKNHPALPWTQIGGLMKLLREREGVSARAIEFAILTACRSGEVRGATWGEIDHDAKLWTIPAERMKAGKEHRVPLSTGAMALLRSLERAGDVVFPGRDKEAPLSDMSLTVVLRRMGRGDITVHGFRSTFRDWCAEAAGNSFSREVCEHALAHSLPDKVEAAYRRGDLLEKRVQLMQAWADYCLG